MKQFFVRPLEHYLFAVVLVIGAYALLVVRADSVPSWQDTLKVAVEKDGNSPSFDATKSNLEIAMAELNATDAAPASANTALEGVRAAFKEPKLLPSQSGLGAQSNAVPLEPLSLQYPSYFGTPDFIPVAGVAPAVRLQQRSLRASIEPISLAPVSPESHFSDRPRGGNQ